jgi:hypothetical protein
MVHCGFSSQAAQSALVTVASSHFSTASSGCDTRHHGRSRPISAVHSIGMCSRNRPFQPLVQFPFSHVRSAILGKSNREQISGKRNPEETRGACINGLVLVDLPNWEGEIGRKRAILAIPLTQQKRHAGRSRDTECINIATRYKAISDRGR